MLELNNDFFFIISLKTAALLMLCYNYSLLVKHILHQLSGLLGPGLSFHCYLHSLNPHHFLLPGVSLRARTGSWPAMVANPEACVQLFAKTGSPFAPI